MTKPEPRQWRTWEYPFKKWPREETFWREMTTRTLSAILAAVVLLLAARLAGFFSSIKWGDIFQAAATSALIFTSVAAAVSALITAIQARKKDKRFTPEQKELIKREIERMVAEGLTLDDLKRPSERDSPPPV